MEQSSGSPSSISSRRNNRSAWFLNISKCEGSSEITINYKNTKGIVAPFSKSKSNANVKIAFGTPEKCDLVVSKDKDETYETLVFTSKRKETARFRVDTPTQTQLPSHRASNQPSMLPKQQNQL